MGEISRKQNSKIGRDASIKTKDEIILLTFFLSRLIIQTSLLSPCTMPPRRSTTTITDPPQSSSSSSTSGLNLPLPTDILASECTPGYIKTAQSSGGHGKGKGKEKDSGGGGGMATNDTDKKMFLQEVRQNDLCWSVSFHYLKLVPGTLTHLFFPLPSFRSSAVTPYLTAHGSKSVSFFARPERLWSCSSERHSGFVETVFGTDSC